VWGRDRQTIRTSIAKDQKRGANADSPRRCSGVSEERRDRRHRLYQITEAVLAAIPRDQRQTIGTKSKSTTSSAASLVPDGMVARGTTSSCSRRQGLRSCSALVGGRAA